MSGRWFQFYLLGVREISDILSNILPLPLLLGVPQGSILGPLATFINMQFVKVCVMLLFADDTNIY